MYSEKESERLSFGALVEEIEVQEFMTKSETASECLLVERLHYQIIKGSGPFQGWISLTGNEKVLAMKIQTSDTPP